MRTGIARRLFVLVGLALSAACTIHEANTPSPTGPSEFAQTIRVTATPDTISQDGSSRSQVVVTVLNSAGQASAGVAVRLDMMVGGVLQDFGSLSARSVVTGADGKANAVYTAPAPPPAGTVAAGSGTTVSIVATAIGSDAQVSQKNAPQAQIRLVPPGVILPPAGTPTASFTVSPTPANVNVPINFNASASTPGTNSNTITVYNWSFGDGGVSGGGAITTHSYSAPGTYTVTLTVTNDRGLSASQSQSVTVLAGQGPTAIFVFSPSAPLVGQTVQFNASASTVPAGRTIASYSWNFGDGSSAAGVTASHTYLTAGTYNATLTVTDDIGEQATTSNPVAVGSGNPTATFTISPTPPVLASTVVTFDGSASTAAAGATISTYRWTFGDGTGAGPSSSPTTTHSYLAAGAGTYTVTLTVTDSAGRTGSFTNTVQVH
jgi:PKD repeat protein